MTPGPGKLVQLNSDVGTKGQGRGGEEVGREENELMGERGKR